MRRFEALWVAGGGVGTLSWVRAAISRSTAPPPEAAGCLRPGRSSHGDTPLLLRRLKARNAAAWATKPSTVRRAWSATDAAKYISS